MVRTDIYFWTKINEETKKKKKQKKTTNHTINISVMCIKIQENTLNASGFLLFLGFICNSFKGWLLVWYDELWDSR